MTPNRGKADIMYEAMNSAEASSRKAERAFIANVQATRVESSTVEICSDRRTELARASSGNLH